MALRWLTLVIVLLSCLHLALALEFMEEMGNEDHEQDSDELPASLTSYTGDTIAHFNPRKADAGFRQLWERIPMQKAEVIKR